MSLAARLGTLLLLLLAGAGCGGGRSVADAAMPDAAMPDSAPPSPDAEVLVTDLGVPLSDAATSPDLPENMDAAAEPQRCGFIQVSTQYHTCAVSADGKLWCWGTNEHGQVGDGTRVMRPSPVLVSSLPGPVVEVAAGYASTCARTTDGAVRCWGLNEHDELGDGTGMNSLQPVAVSGLSAPSISLSAGFFFQHATVLIGGSVWIWGHRGTTVSDGTPRLPTPVAVKGLAAGARSVSCGWAHSCALAPDQTVWCWGSGEGLGNGGLSSLDAVKVPLPSGAIRVNAGVHATCAVLLDGSLWCWGRDAEPTPTMREPFSKDVADVCVGQNFGCTLRTDGSVWCWGQNFFGELGDSGPASTGRPVTGVTGRVRDIECGTFHVCAVLENGTLSCWGDNRSGGANYGTPTTITVPIPPACSR